MKRSISECTETERERLGMLLDTLINAECIIEGFHVPGILIILGDPAGDIYFGNVGRREAAEQLRAVADKLDQLPERGNTGPRINDIALIAAPAAKIKEN